MNSEEILKNEVSAALSPLQRSKMHYLFHLESGTVSELAVLAVPIVLCQNLKYVYNL